MKTSESQSALIEALLAAQAKFPSIDKTKEGQSGHRKFKYAPLDVVLNAVRPVLLENRLLLTQCVEGDSIITRLDHASGEWRESSMPVNAEHANMQSYGIELTYRRRYALQPMLGIVTEEDTDGTGSQKRRGKDHTDPRNDNGTLSAGGVISATTGAEDNVSDDRKPIIEEIALTVVDAFSSGQGMKAAAIWYAPDTFKENEERVYCWKLLSKESKLRAFLKANKPRPLDEAWQAAH